jgi:hypothetical protein
MRPFDEQEIRERAYELTGLYLQYNLQVIV